MILKGISNIYSPRKKFRVRNDLLQTQFSSPCLLKFFLRATIKANLGSLRTVRQPGNTNASGHVRSSQLTRPFARCHLMLERMWTLSNKPQKIIYRHTSAGHENAPVLMRSSDSSCEKFCAENNIILVPLSFDKLYLILGNSILI